METPGAGAAAYGGPGWSARTAPHRAEIGALWSTCGIDGEWRRLARVLLCRPGAELGVADPDAAQYLARPDPVRAGESTTPWPRPIAPWVSR